MPNPLRARYRFRHGAVHDANDRMARYVVRLSIALNDLRTAAQYATRRRQNAAERSYFVRLTASHLRELILIMDPPNTRVIPSLEDFLASLPRGVTPSRADIRRSHADAMSLLDRPMAAGRPNITVPNGTMRPPKLRDDLKELRNRFFHYGHEQSGDEALQTAMTALAGEMTGYEIRERTMRANYADDVGVKLAHPFDLAFARDIHTRIVDLIGPVSGYVHQVEAAWIYAHADDVAVRRPGARPEKLVELLAKRTSGV